MSRTVADEDAGGNSVYQSLAKDCGAVLKVRTHEKPVRIYIGIDVSLFISQCSEAC